MKDCTDKEWETMEMENRIHIFREDLKGDVMQSAKLVHAAREERWDDVEKLLEEGADPRICRAGDAYGYESALFYALSAKKFEIARKLYEAGDRLDDLIVETESYRIPAEVLNFLAFEMRQGDNYFYDESKPLSECCRCSAFAQIEKLIDTASQEELNRSIAPTVRSWIRHFNYIDVYAPLMEDLLEKGAKLTEAAKAELLADLDRRFGARCPKILHPGEEAVRRMTELVQRA